MSGSVAILQARMGSERLPGKVLKDLEGEPMIARVVTRTRRAKGLDRVVVATTTDSSDDAIAGLCTRHGWPFYRGSPTDLLDRYYQAAKIHAAGTVVRITCDCPLTDPELIDRVIGSFREGAPVDYASNTLPPHTFPRGLDVEVFSFAALERAWREDRDPSWREHVTPYLYRHPELFKLRRIADHRDHSALRLTVDTPEDFELTRRIYADLGRDDFTWHEAVALLDAHPDWLELNRHVGQREVR